MNNANDAKRTYRPALRFYHANAKGTGSAMKFELHPAHDDTDGSIWVCAANQMTVGDRRGPNPTYPRFDWENKIVVKLDFNDLCQFLQVLRGECEEIGDGKGLFHASVRANTQIKLRHVLEPTSGYSLEFYRSSREGVTDASARMFFSPSEATGLCEAIAGSMAVISFGIPCVIPHVANEPAVRGRERDADAA